MTHPSSIIHSQLADGQMLDNMEISQSCT